MSITFLANQTIRQDFELVSALPEEVFCHTRFVHELPGYGETTWIIIEVEGKIGNLSHEATKEGLAGVEATFRVNTGGESSRRESVSVEILGWWQYGKYVTGVCIYDNNKTPTYQYDRYANVNKGELLTYRVHVIPGYQIITHIWNSSGTKIFEDVYKCDAKRIITFQTELEYWRYSEPGSFNFNGKVTVEAGYRKDVGWVNLGDVCSFYEDTYCPNVPCCEFLHCNHYLSEGHWILEGEIRDL